MSTKDDALIKDMLKAFKTISSEFGDDFVAMRVVLGVVRKAFMEEAALRHADESE
jgi:hypothetical protein